MDLVNDLDHFKGKGEGNEVQVSIRISLFPLYMVLVQEPRGEWGGADLEAEVEFCS